MKLNILVIICKVSFSFLVFILLSNLLLNIFFVTDGNFLYKKTDELFISDKEIGYKLKPNFFKKGEENNLYPGIDVSINSSGYRNPPLDTRNKILILGDSVAFGFGLSFENTIAGQLENSLQSQYQVLNGGVPGYNTDQWIKAGEKSITSIKPKIIVAILNANDFQSRYYLIQGGGTVTRSKSFPWEEDLLEEQLIENIKLNKKVNVFLVLKQILKNKHLLKSVARSKPNNDDITEEMFKEELKQIKYYNSGKQIVLEQKKYQINKINKFVKLCIDKNIKIVLVFFPFRVSTTKKILIDQRFEEILKSIPVDKNVQVINLTSELNKEIFFLPGDSHPSAQGNKLISELISKKIKTSQKLE